MAIVLAAMVLTVVAGAGPRESREADTFTREAEFQDRYDYDFVRKDLSNDLLRMDLSHEANFTEGRRNMQATDTSCPLPEQYVGFVKASPSYSYVEIKDMKLRGRDRM